MWHFSAEKKLRRAIARDDVAKVRALLAKGKVDVNACNEDYLGGTALHSTTRRRQLQVVELLLKANADPDATDTHGETPLRLGIELGHLDVADLLLKAGANPNATNKSGQTALHDASSRANLQVIDMLLKANADPDATDTAGRTALHDASSQDRVRVVDMLLKANADPDATNKTGRTPLHEASAKGNAQVVKMLLKANANPHAANKSGYTSLHLASRFGHLQVVEQLLETNTDLNAANKFGETPLHFACLNHESEVARALLASGADPNRRDKDRYKPLHCCICRLNNDFTSDRTYQILKTLQVLVARGSTWDATCDDMVAEGSAWNVAPALRICLLLWTQELADRLPFTDIPVEIIRRGTTNTRTFIDNLKTSRQVVLRRKICLVGPSCAGKASLVKSITAKEPQLEHVEDRTIGIDHFPYRFEQVVVSRNDTKIHEVTFWDFAGQDAYQVAHALFFSPRTMFLVCVDLVAFSTAYLQASIMANVRKQEAQLMDEFIERTVMHWIRIILARQPDAEFVFIATKEDFLAENNATEQLLKTLLMSKLKQVGTTVDHMKAKLTSDEWTAQNHASFVSDRHDDVDAPAPCLMFASCTSPASVQAARARIENLIVESERSFQMPNNYTLVLDAIVAIREAAAMDDITTRIKRVFVPVGTLSAQLKIEPELCRTILHTLHDLGDVLWYEHLGVKLFQDTVILDPMLLIDFIRQVINHKHAGVTLSHADLKALPFWVGLSNMKQMEAMKQVLQQFRLVYSADENRIMEWDSDLIVPAFWQTKTPAAWLFLGDMLRLKSATPGERELGRVDWEHHFPRAGTTKSRMGESVRVHWEYHFEFGLPSSLFDHVVVACVLPHFQFRAGPDWIVYEENEVVACRIMVGRDRESLHRTIHIEAVVADRATTLQVDTLWRSFRYVCGAFLRVLWAYPGLAVSSFAWDNAHEKVGLKRLTSPENSAKWMPPAATWEWIKHVRADPKHPASNGITGNFNRPL